MASVSERPAAARVRRPPGRPPLVKLCPPPPPGRRRVPARLACLIYMLVLIAAAVGLDRLIAGRLFADPGTYVPAFRSFQDYDVGVKLNQFRQVENERYSGFFVGNSRTMFGVNPAVFDAGLRRRSVASHTYNLAQESVDVQFWQPFFTRYYQRPPPHYVFLGLLPRDLDVGYTPLGEKFMDAFFASAGFQSRDMSPINRAAEEALSKLFILHGRISDTRLITLSDILHGRKLNLEQARLANQQGWMQLPTSVQDISKAFLASEARRLAHRPGRQPFALGHPQERSLIALNSWVRRGHGCLILYTTPLLYDEEPWGTELMRRGFDVTMRRLVSQIPGLQFVDIGGRTQSGYTPADFGDGDHLDGRGATKFSAALAGALAPAMRSSACTAG
ncbi:MAG: hypothetical protein JOZ07_10035 [Solirubrobacterales bacterium]|nr:hypothetical protein [Solirubrobacterales bacterium]